MRQKTRSRLKRIALLIASAILMVNFGSLIGLNTVRAEGISLTDVATMELVSLYKKVGNDTIPLLGDDPGSLDYGETLYAHLKWTFPDAPNRVEISVGTEYTYELPTGITFSTLSGDLLNDQEVVGTYNIANRSITIVYSDDEAGNNFVSGQGRNTELTFSGVITLADTNNQYLRSTTLNFNGIGERTIALVPPADPTTLEVNKDRRDDISTSTEHRYRYTAYVTSHGQNNNVVINDWTSQGLYMQADTIRLYSDFDCQTPYTGATQVWSDTTGFKYTVPSMADGETIYFRYEVVVDNALYNRADAAASFSGYHGNVTNTLEAFSDTSAVIRDYNDIGTYSVYINKYHARTDVDNGTITWQIFLYGIPDNFNNGYVIDTLPDNNTYVEGSLNVIYWGDDYTSSVQLEQLDNGQLKFTLGSDVIDYLKNISGANCVITYTTKITEQHSSYVIYENRAVAYYNGDPVDEATADTGFTMPPIITKRGVYNDATAPNAIFTLTINPLALNVDTADDILTLNDQFPDTYDLQVSSVTITRNDGSPVTTESFTYNETSKILTLNLLDKTAYTITYRATVNRRVGTELNANNSTNTVTIEDVTPVISGSTSFECQVVRSAGSASSYNPNIATLNVIKHEEGDTTNVLQGAKFTLTAMTVGSSGTVTAGSAVVQTTNANGIASFEVDREKIYMLTETLAPTGYELDENIYFYAFADTNSTLPATVTYNGHTYTVTIIESDRVSRDVYFADEASAVAIVDPTTPTEPTVPATGETTAAATPSETTTPSAAGVAETTTPTTATTTAEPTQATEAVNAVPASTGDIDPNAVNGAGRGVTTTQAEDTAVTATTTTGAVTSTGESLSHARILGVLTIFVSFMFLILIRRERKEGMYEGNKYI